MHLKGSSIWSPVLILATALAGGIVLNYLARQSTPHRQRHSASLRTPMQMPSARLGAREDQIDHTMQHPSHRAFESGAASPTGAAYDLDPNSITAG
jgi:hypothetical protein